MEWKRRDRELQLEALREMEEKVIEERRQELLSEENGYWKLRMEADNSHKVGQSVETVICCLESMRFEHLLMRWKHTLAGECAAVKFGQERIRFHECQQSS